MPARQIIVYVDCWPVTTAVAHLVRIFLPGSDCESTYRLPELLQQLSRKPEAILILCLRPREHLFLFYALRRTLPEHPVMVISDELLFSDRVVLKLYGGGASTAGAGAGRNTYPGAYACAERESWTPFCYHRLR